MERFIETLYERASWYFKQFFELIVNDKETIEKIIGNKRIHAGEAILFSFFSIGIAVLAYAVIEGLTSSEAAKILVLLTLPVMFLIASMTIIVTATFGRLGSKISGKQYLAIHAYLFGVLIISWPIAVLIATEAFRTVNAVSPDLYRNIWVTLSTHQLPSPSELCLGLVPFLAMVPLIWHMTWMSRVRRVMHRRQGLSRGRNCIAQVLFGLCWLLTCGAIAFMYQGLLRISLAS